MSARTPFLISLILLLLAPVNQTAGAGAAGARNRTLIPLWKVAGPNCTVHLLGSIHFLKVENYPLAGPIESAFTNARIAVFEADMEEMETADAMLKLMSKGQLPPDQSLRELLSADVYTNFLRHAQSAGLPEAMFQRLKPSFAAITVVAVELQRLGFDPQLGVDKHFYGRARKSGKTIEGLETVDFQIDLITGFSAAEEDLVVKSTLKDFENIQAVVGDLVKSWETGDAETLEKLLNEATREAPVIFKRLITDRNERWTPRIAELASGGRNAIVIVGAGHLVGKEGVVNLLKNRGLDVTQEFNRP